MTLRKNFPLLMVASLLCAPQTVQADSTQQVINGGTCIPYPPYDRASNVYTGLNWQHWLYGFGGTAFCHLIMPGDWQLKTLSYVLFTGWTQPGQVVTARLCVNSFDLAVTCGSAVTISGAPYQVNYVLPPPLPPYADGAFVKFDFPSNSVSGVIQLIPVWVK